MYVLVSLCGMLRLIRINTLRRVHNVGFLVERLKLGIKNIKQYAPHQGPCVEVSVSTLRQSKNVCVWRTAREVKQD